MDLSTVDDLVSFLILFYYLLLLVNFYDEKKILNQIISYFVSGKRDQMLVNMIVVGCRVCKKWNKLCRKLSIRYFKYILLYLLLRIKSFASRRGTMRFRCTYDWKYDASIL